MTEQEVRAAKEWIAATQQRARHQCTLIRQFRSHGQHDLAFKAQEVLERIERSLELAQAHLDGLIAAERLIDRAQTASATVGGGR
ncbi:MAG: hypothetical protein J0H67_08455 [Rhodospirillales bacterium]|nr:hypothetical protein [Rhodospirillales bacterium]